MEVLVTVVDTGNFTLAGHKLGVTTVMIGRQIRQLEELLGTRLLQRSTRKQSLTDAGLLFCRSAKEILDNVARAQEAVQDGHVEPRGRLRVAAPVTIGGSVIAPLIAQYQQRFPQVEIELVLGNAMVNLIDDGIDLAVRIGALPDGGRAGSFCAPRHCRCTWCTCGAHTHAAGWPAWSISWSWNWAKTPGLSRPWRMLRV